MSEAADLPAIVFRAPKKRKYRQKLPESDYAATENPIVKKEAADEPSTPDTKDDQDAIHLSDALRLRKARKNRPKGITFRAHIPGQNKEWVGIKDEAREEDGDRSAEGDMVSIYKRFVPQTGTNGELVNKHM